MRTWTEGDRAELDDDDRTWLVTIVAKTRNEVDRQRKELKRLETNSLAVELSWREWAVRTNVRGYRLHDAETSIRWLTDRDAQIVETTPTC